MENAERAAEIARENGAVCIKHRPEWNGREVWEMCFQMPEEPRACIGYPQYIIFSKHGVHLSEDEEASEYMEYLNEKFGDDEDDQMDYEDEEVIKV